MGRIARYQNLDKFVQVFLEDMSIAILLVRFQAAVGPAWATVTVGLLFAAAHAPAMITHGASPTELAHLIVDAALGVAVISVLRHSRDIVWLFLIHFCLDMTQFAQITFGR